MTHPVDPVDLDPIPPLLDSYTYHSVPHEAGEGWIMGIDEAGRGPVLGPMVYAAAYCPASFKQTLEDLGFDDSKALSADVRQALWDAFTTHAPLCYSSTTLSPQSISAGMLRRVPVNLNRQAEDATIGLIRSALERGINVVECYVDALGPSPQWQARLTDLFPSIAFTVCPKADSLFKIVSAASIVAKVTRDRYIEHWVDAEDTAAVAAALGGSSAASGVQAAAADGESTPGDAVVRGSGYPSDPKTQAYLRDALDPVFGYKGIVRFSWATVKVLLDKQAAACRWVDDGEQRGAGIAQWAAGDAGRPKVWRELGVVGVGDL
ncbi:hypothetical protein Q5752_006975 [Cryptotrichosporon argae]